MGVAGGVALQVVARLPFELAVLPEDLRRVEFALVESVRTEDAYMTDVAGHLIAAGGKRLRPAMAMAAAHTGGILTISDDVVQGAAAVELVHLGSLYHDDVMDEAATRRGVPSANIRFGNVVAILAGDFLLAKASEIAASLGTEVAGLLAHTIGQLCQGQVLELQSVFSPNRTQAQYLASIDGKTASLLATSARIGAIVAGLPRAHIDAITAYGQRLGMVFQIVDDILDLTATDEQLGKPAGNDLVEGIYTLPVIVGLQDPHRGEELRALLGAPIDRADVDRVRKVVQATGGVEAAMAVGRQYSDEAAAALATLTPTDVTRDMAMAGHRLIDSLPH